MPCHDFLCRNHTCRIVVLYIVDLVEELPHTDSRAVTPSCHDVTEVIAVTCLRARAVEELTMRLYITLTHAKHYLDVQILAEGQDMVETSACALVHVFSSLCIAVVVESVLSVDREIPVADPHTCEVTAVLCEIRKHSIEVESVVLLVKVAEELGVILCT